MTFEIPVWFQISSLVVLTLILIVDLVLAVKRPHIPSMKESTLWVVFYVGLALVFAVVLYFVSDSADAMGQFLAGWLTEYSLSIDNLFVFVLIMAQFAVPRKYQQQVLMVGIIIALILRGIFIMLGAALIEQFSWIFYIFGADPRASPPIVRRSRSRMRTTCRPRRASCASPVGSWTSATTTTAPRSARSSDGKKIWTPMILVFIAIGIHRPDLRDRLDPGDLRHHPEPVHRVHGEHLRAHGPAPALLPARRPARPPQVPALRHRVHPRLHRREAGLPRPAHQRGAVHQRRRAGPVGAGDLDLDVARSSSSLSMAVATIASLISSGRDKKREAAAAAAAAPGVEQSPAAPDDKS